MSDKQGTETANQQNHPHPCNIVMGMVAGWFLGPIALPILAVLVFGIWWLAYSITIIAAQSAAMPWWIWPIWAAAHTNEWLMGRLGLPLPQISAPHIFDISLLRLPEAMFPVMAYLMTFSVVLMVELQIAVLALRGMAVCARKVVLS